jgi:hypothetical protein
VSVPSSLHDDRTRARNLRFAEREREAAFQRQHEFISVLFILRGMTAGLLAWLGLQAGVAVFAPEHLACSSMWLAFLYPLLDLTIVLSRSASTSAQRARIQLVAMAAHVPSFACSVVIGRVRMGRDALALDGVVSHSWNVSSVSRHRIMQGALIPSLAWAGPLLMTVTVLQCLIVARHEERVCASDFCRTS